MAVETLKPQDIFAAAALTLCGAKHPSHAELAVLLRVSPSTVYESLKRLKQARLTSSSEHGPVIAKGRFFEFLVHAVPTLYFPQKTEVVRGIPTAMWAPQFKDKLGANKDIISVWPYTKGKEVGEGLTPIYPTVPLACSQNMELYQFMAAIEVLRIGKARERESATAYLQGFLNDDCESIKEAS
jgi:hypothetical protein